MDRGLLFCAGCNVRYRVSKLDPDKVYNCPKCSAALKLLDHTQAGVTQGTLDDTGKLEKVKPRDPMVGKRVGQYLILAKLGEGGMGAVYKAKHVELERIVALKFLSPKIVAAQPEALQRFVQEAKAVATLDHPNVATVYAVGHEGEHHFIAMQFVDGGSLEDRLRIEKRLDPDEAVRVTVAAAHALHAAHRRKIVHRDIKPANIMLTNDDSVKVMDFGLAKDVASATNLTMSGAIMGTPYYMSPEQCEGKAVEAALATWRSCIEACQRTHERSRSGLAALVGQPYKVYVKAGKSGRIGMTGKVERFEDGKLFVRVGHTLHEIPRSELGPATIARLGAGPGARGKFEQAALLYLEGSGESAWPALRAAKEQARGDANLIGQIDRTEAIWTERDAVRREKAILGKITTALALVQTDLETADWESANARLGSLKEKYGRATAYGQAQATLSVFAESVAALREQAAATLIDRAQALAAEQQPSQAAEILRTLAKKLSDTAAYARAQPGLDALRAKLADAWVLWKRLCPTVPVPGPDDKLHQLPAGVITDVEYSPDGQLLAVAHSFGVDLLDTRTWKIVQRLDGHQAALTGISLGPRGRRLVTGAGDGTIILSGTLALARYCAGSEYTASLPPGA